MKSFEITDSSVKEELWGIVDGLAATEVRGSSLVKAKNPRNLVSLPKNHR